MTIIANAKRRARSKGILHRGFFVYLRFDGIRLDDPGKPRKSQNPTFKFEVFSRVFRAYFKFIRTLIAATRLQSAFIHFDFIVIPPQKLLMPAIFGGGVQCT